jgi:hypothetical protein
MVTESKPNWQPLSLLPVVAMMIDEVVQNSEEQHETFSEVKDKPHVLDDATVSRAIRLYKAQLEDVQLYREQLTRWQAQPLTGDQRREVDRLLGQLSRLKQLSEAILEMLDEIKEGTIDRIMAKSDVELGMEYLLENFGGDPGTAQEAVDMPLTKEQLRLARSIDKYVNDTMGKGGDDADILRGMHSYMGTFKQVMDMSSEKEMLRLCQQYDGFYRFAKLLEALAGGIADGEIQVPR